MNQCIACGLDFKSAKSFDDHRVFTNPKKDDWKTRRCLTKKELIDMGMEPDNNGRWRVPMPQECLSKLYTPKSRAVNDEGVQSD